MEIRKLSAACREAVPTLRRLWHDADPREALERTGDDDYHLFGGFVDGDLVGVAGVLARNHLHHVPHAWLYDLVGDEPRRSEGHGTELVAFVEEWAADRDCESVALAKTDAHEYYEELDFEKWGYVVEKELRDQSAPQR